MLFKRRVHRYGKTCSLRILTYGRARERGVSERERDREGEREEI